MCKSAFQTGQVSKFFLLTIILGVGILSGCGVEAAKTDTAEKPSASVKSADTQTNLSPREADKYSKPATIEIKENSPADTIRVFYQHLREKRVREALFLTNLRPAIEGLTDAELEDLQVDFEPIARAIPTDVEINGEIISGNYASVTVKLPDNETRELKVQEIRLRKEPTYWLILTVDEKAETTIKKQGNRYFSNLKLNTHEAEAKAMLERIYKSQSIYVYQSGGAFGELAQLIESGMLPEDAQTSESTGYNFKITLSADKKNYFATAEPADYGKTGRLSYLLELDGQKPRITSKDNQGQPLKK